MAFYTSKSKEFSFPDLPDNKKSKKAFVCGFIGAIASSPLSATEKVAWLKYANELPVPPGGGGPEEIDPVAGPGPGFLPEGAPEEQQIQQLLEALPGNTPEEKLQSAVMALLEAQQGGGGEMGGAPGGVEGPETGVEEEGGQLDPALLQQLLSQTQGGAPGPGGPQG